MGSVVTTVSLATASGTITQPRHQPRILTSEMTQHQHPEDVQGILNTLLVPMDPPNRSQWRKLELAMKFINISKQSVANSRRLQEQQRAQNRRNSGAACTVTGAKKTPASSQDSSLKHPRTEKRPLISGEDTGVRHTKLTMKLEPLDGNNGVTVAEKRRRDVVPAIKKRDSWGDKLKHAAVQIMVLPFEFDAQRS